VKFEDVTLMTPLEEGSAEARFVKFEDVTLMTPLEI